MHPQQFVMLVTGNLGVQAIMKGQLGILQLVLLTHNLT